MEKMAHNMITNVYVAHKEMRQWEQLCKCIRCDLCPLGAGPAPVLGPAVIPLFRRMDEVLLGGAVSHGRDDRGLRRQRQQLLLLSLRHNLDKGVLNRAGNEGPRSFYSAQRSLIVELLLAHGQW